MRKDGEMDFPDMKVKYLLMYCCYCIAMLFIVYMVYDGTNFFILPNFTQLYTKT
jgi:hypothetical protein